MNKAEKYRNTVIIDYSTIVFFSLEEKAFKK